jgi:hypothetical protein
MKKFMFAVVSVALAATLAGCGGDKTTGGGGNNKTTPIITWATPVAITYGTALSSTQLNATASVAGSFVYTPASGTVPTAGTNTLSVNFTPADTTNYYTASGNVQLTVNKVTPTVSVWPMASTITSGQTLASSTLTGGCTASVSGTCAWTAPSTVPAVGTDPESVTFTPTDTVNYAAVTGSVSVVVNTPAPTLTSITFADGRPVKYCVGQCGIFPITITGTNFTTGQTVSCTPDSDIQSVTLNSSTQLTVSIAIDQTHEGSGARSCKVCKTDGTGCSASVSFGLYGPNDSSVSSGGEKFALNSQQVIAGQNAGRNGYVNKFVKTTGAPDGNLFVGAPTCCIAVDNLTGFWSYGLAPIDQNGSQTSTPIIAGGYADQIVGIAAKNGYACVIQPTQNNLSCVSWQGTAFTTNTVMHTPLGTNPQSLAMGVIGGKTYAFVLTVGGGTPLLWSVDVSDGMTNVISQSIVGITSGAPGGSAVVTLDTAGRVAVISFGDDFVALFNESTLASTATITSSGMPSQIPVNMIGVGSNLLVGNFNGTFTKVTSTGTVTLVSSEQTAFMPVALIPAVAADGAGVDFYACPNDGVNSCSSFTLP